MTKILAILCLGLSASAISSEPASGEKIEMEASQVKQEGSHAEEHSFLAGMWDKIKNFFGGKKDHKDEHQKEEMGSKSGSEDAMFSLEPVKSGDEAEKNSGTKPAAEKSEEEASPSGSVEKAESGSGLVNGIPVFGGVDAAQKKQPFTTKVPAKKENKKAEKKKVSSDEEE
jgi:hypothetical protein